MIKKLILAPLVILLSGCSDSYNCKYVGESLVRNGFVGALVNKEEFKCGEETFYFRLGTNARLNGVEND